MIRKCDRTLYFIGKLFEDGSYFMFWDSVELICLQYDSSEQSYVGRRIQNMTITVSADEAREHVKDAIEVPAPCSGQK